jgi:mRNA interferase RelE/StbE
MSYDVKVGPQAKKELARLERTLARRLRDRLRELAANPYDPRLSRQLEMDPEKCYSRVGNWRIIFAGARTRS